MAKGCHYRDASLPKGLMNTGVGKGGDGISSERGQKDKRHNSVTEIVVIFDLLLGKSWGHCLGDEGTSRTYGIKAYNLSANGCLLTVKITHSNCGVIHSSNGER